MELISNPMEQRAFERMDEDIRLIGYFKGEESEREWHFCVPLKYVCKIIILWLCYNKYDSLIPFIVDL